MSTDFQPTGPLRRTRSTGDIPNANAPPPDSVRVSPRCRHSVSHSSPANTSLPSGRTIIDEPTSAPTTDPPPPPPIAPTPSTRIWTLPHTLVEEEANIPQPDALPPDGHNNTPSGRNRSWYRNILAFFGFGRNASRLRRELVSLIWSLSWGFVQIVAIITVLSLATTLKSPTSPHLNEWQACSKPLGPWCCLWIIRACLSSGLAYWDWDRERAAILRGDTESNNTNLAQPTQIAQAHDVTGGATVSAGITATAQPANGSDPPPHRSRLYTRLILVYSLLTLTWFLTAHILEYTSVYTCRFSSPHLWYLTFAILCIMYIKILQIVLLGLAVFIVAPLLFLFWNILLICLGRHPLQNPAAAMKPEIERLPRAIIDAIPLVMYIPPPPNEPSKGPITIPENIHVYPPMPPVSVPLRKRFRFLRRKPAKGKQRADGAGTTKGQEKKTPGDEIRWEDCWEQGDYPFVRLEGNRAACAICLVDFAEPKRIVGVAKGNDEKTEETKPQVEDPLTTEGEVQEVRIVDMMGEHSHTQLKLTDAGEGPQPLRLLECGHVFHKTCLDPWLHDVSGRCPLCQQAVVIPDPSPQRRRRRR